MICLEDNENCEYFVIVEIEVGSRAVVFWVIVLDGDFNCSLLLRLEGILRLKILSDNRC